MEGQVLSPIGVWKVKNSSSCRYFLALALPLICPLLVGDFNGTALLAGIWSSVEGGGVGRLFRHARGCSRRYPQR